MFFSLFLFVFLFFQNHLFFSDSTPKTDLPSGKYGDGHEVASDAEASNEEGGGQRDVGEPREDCHSRVLV